MALLVPARSVRWQGWDGHAAQLDTNGSFNPFGYPKLGA